MKFIRETLAMFPNRVRAIVRDERGINLVLSDQDNVPVSSPLYVRILMETMLITGDVQRQEIQIAGQKLTVLSDAQGGIILMGNDFAWSSREPSFAKSDLKIEAKNLGSVVM